MGMYPIDAQQSKGHAVGISIVNFDRINNETPFFIHSL
jgi:hypothetical protein